MEKGQEIAKYGALVHFGLGHTLALMEIPGGNPLLWALLGGKYGRPKKFFAQVPPFPSIHPPGPLITEGGRVGTRRMGLRDLFRTCQVHQVELAR